MTPAQQAFAEGFAALDEVHGSPCTFSDQPFVGRIAELKADDPRLVGSADRLLEFRISPANLPETLPKRGDEFARDGITYRVSNRPYIDPATGETVLLIVEA